MTKKYFFVSIIDIENSKVNFAKLFEKVREILASNFSITVSNDNAINLHVKDQSHLNLFDTAQAAHSQTTSNEFCMTFEFDTESKRLLSIYDNYFAQTVNGELACINLAGLLL